MAEKNKKLVRSKSGLRMVSSVESTRCPFELCEPPWIADNECSQCMNCHVRFDFIKRRHHCRRCGKIFCSSCCEEKVSLPRMCFVDPVRLCSPCAEVTRKENDFYDRQLKTLTNGANFTVSSRLSSIDDNNNTFLCRLSTDHKQLIFENQSNKERFDPVSISSIHNVRAIKSADESQGKFPIPTSPRVNVFSTVEQKNLN
ncbi:Zinc finger FYVE domain-containing protein 21 [Chamberlinius hualienensis]